MQPRLEAMRRLVSLYSAIEEMHSIELQRKSAAVREADIAIEKEQVAIGAAREEGHEALLIGNRESWVLTCAQRETAEWRRDQLAQVKAQREQLHEAAREQYVASRLRREQVNRVQDDIATWAKLEEDRRNQAVADDRFLARYRWTDARKKQREGQR